MADSPLALFPNGAAERDLPVRLPKGRLITPDAEMPCLLPSQEVAAPAYWLSDMPASAETWARLRAEHHRSGLWPLLLLGHPEEPSAPWARGFVSPEPLAWIDPPEKAGNILENEWNNAVEPGGDPQDLPWWESHEIPAELAWPGLAEPGVLTEECGVVADRCAALLADGVARLGLVAVERSADVLTVAGWQGAMGSSGWEEPSGLSSILRSWEERFGARVVRIGADTLDLSVAAPPTTEDHALHVAAEHLAFCPSTVDRFLLPDEPLFLLVEDIGLRAFSDYASSIVGKHMWSFAWEVV